MKLANSIDELIARHQTWVFDCDGVILDSNVIKTEAFRKVASTFGEDLANRLVSYHVTHGGISRFSKFEWFLREVLGGKFNHQLHESLCAQYGVQVKNALAECEYTTGFLELLQRLNSAGIFPYVVSGGFEEELHEVFSLRKIGSSFAAIFGSPRTKQQILAELEIGGVNISSGIFWGDAKADHDAAAQSGMKFVFVKKYSEALPWFSSVADSVDWVESFSDVLD
jgi:phosphoglycolate phosphatase-like HAD superfamily hydrolase